MMTKMTKTKGEIRERLILMVGVAALGSFVGDYTNLAGASIHAWVGAALEAILAGIIAWRAFIDKSPAMLQDPNP